VLYITGQDCLVCECAFNIVYLLLTPVQDIVGRRPVILAGATGVAITTVLFGLCRSLPSVIAVRFLGMQNFLTRIRELKLFVLQGGLFAANVAVINR
jgi:MFS family permease